MQHNIYTQWGVNMTTSSRTCPVPAVNGHMTHYPAAPYPLLFPPVIGGLSLPSLHGLQSHPPTSGCSTPSPASRCLVLIAFIDQISSKKDWSCFFWNYLENNCSCSPVMYFTWAKSMHLFWNTIFTYSCFYKSKHATIWHSKPVETRADKTCYGLWHILHYCASCRIQCCV